MKYRKRIGFSIVAALAGVVTLLACRREKHLSLD